MSFYGLEGSTSEARKSLNVEDKLEPSNVNILLTQEQKKRNNEDGEEDEEEIVESKPRQLDDEAIGRRPKSF